jgi:hypothetical protein
MRLAGFGHSERVLSWTLIALCGSTIAAPAAAGRGGRRIGMDRGRLAVCDAEGGSELLVWPVVGIDEAKIIVLAVRAAAFWLVVILEPLAADDLGTARNCASPPPRRGRARPAWRRSSDGRCCVAGAVLARREKPFGYQYRLAAGQARSASK